MTASPIISGTGPPSNVQTDIDTSPGRLVSLDVLRGAAISAMILVNNPGSWEFIYSPLRHAEWNGWNLADLVFPFFLFITGVSLVFSCRRRTARGISRRALFVHILWRVVVLIALGLVLNGFFYLPFREVRNPQASSNGLASFIYWRR